MMLLQHVVAVADLLDEVVVVIREAVLRSAQFLLVRAVVEQPPLPQGLRFLCRVLFVVEPSPVALGRLHVLGTLAPQPYNVAQQHAVLLTQVGQGTRIHHLLMRLEANALREQVESRAEPTLLSCQEQVLRCIPAHILVAHHVLPLVPPFSHHTAFNPLNNIACLPLALDSNSLFMVVDSFRYIINFIVGCILLILKSHDHIFSFVDFCLVTLFLEVIETFPHPLFMEVVPPLFTLFKYHMIMVVECVLPLVEV